MPSLNLRVTERLPIHGSANRVAKHEIIPTAIVSVPLRRDIELAPLEVQTPGKVVAAREPSETARG